MVRIIKLIFLSLSLLMGCTYQDRYEIDANSTISQHAPSSGHVFLQFDATQFTDKHLWLGKKVHIISEYELLGNSNTTNKAPNELKIKSILSRYKDEDRIIFDFHSWTILKNNKLDPLAELHAQWYQMVLSWAKDALPSVDIGFVGLPVNAWGFSEYSDDYNQALEVSWPIMILVDSLYPNFDVKEANIEQIKIVGDIFIKIAKNLNKPIYPLIWHRGSDAEFKDKILPFNIIEEQCYFIRHNADGVVWWSGAGESWDGGAWYPAAANCLR